MTTSRDCLFALPKPGEGPFKGWFALLNLILLYLLEYTSTASTQYDNAFPYNANLFSSQMYVNFFRIHSWQNFLDMQKQDYFFSLIQRSQTLVAIQVDREVKNCGYDNDT